MSVRHCVASLFSICLVWLAVRPADAIPVFAHRYGLTCQACHTTIPHLTAFGDAFLARGYRIPGLPAKNTTPVALKVKLGYTSGSSGGDADATTTGPLPKATVTEVELLIGGSLGSRTSYFSEAYMIDGGFPGRVRDMWISQRITRDGAPTPISLRVGQMALQLPVDPETFRETSDPYAIYSLNGYRNPFTFFAPKLGATVLIGSQLAGTSGAIGLYQGREAGSALAASGLDRSLYVQHVRGEFTTSAYRYDGTRPVLGGDDRFWRQGYGLAWERSRTHLDAVYQTGFDTRADEFGDGLFSSGGFLQLRQDVGRRMFAIARWDGVQGNDFARSVTAGMGFRPLRNMRFTVFDSVKPNPIVQRNMHTLSTQLLFAY
ncbi:MAG: hypothetical protein NVS4B13_08180 [Candidatus Elarobacter sp.]